MSYKRDPDESGDAEPHAVAHDFHVKTCGVPGVQWNYQATCVCGWKGTRGVTERVAQQEWRSHRNEFRSAT